MKYGFCGVAVLLCLLGTGVFAQQRIPDLSLTPEEEAREPASISNGQPNYGNTNNWNRATPMPNYNSGSRYSGSGDTIQQRIDMMRNQNQGGALPMGMAPSNVFTNYCNNTSGMAQQCAVQDRQQLCQLFLRLPIDAQRILDDAASCETQEPGAIPALACADSQSRLLQALKRYWQNREVSYALLFLPDMLKAQACMQGMR